MSLLLHIDTALGKASVSLASGEALIAVKENQDMRDQAAWIHTAIRDLLQENGCTTASLSAIAVVAGPGSYTGLRIGLATAKGLCYALQIPLITINTLELIAHAAQAQATDLVCAIIDARRMKAIMALYNKAGAAIIEPEARIITGDSFADILDQHHVVFAGNSNTKVSSVIKHPHAVFLENNYTVTDICAFANRMYQMELFTELAYAEPYYVKEYYSTSGT